MKTPIISKVYHDPSRSIPRVKRFEKEAKRRFNELSTALQQLLTDRLTGQLLQGNVSLELWDYDFAVNSERWDYSGMTGRQLAELQEQIAYLINSILNGETTVEGNYYENWTGYFIEVDYETGTRAAINNLVSQSALISESVTLQQVLFSQVYQSRLSMVMQQSYSDWLSISDSIRGDLGYLLGESISAGVHPNALAKAIADKSDTLYWKAQRFARTELIGAYRKGRIQQSEQDEKDYGVKIKYLWLSALSPTTRRTHAARHGHLYTAEEIQKFYSEKGNRYNCKCSFTEVIVNGYGDPVSPTLQKRLDEQRVKWVEHLDKVKK